jgi:putative ABC transport system permease protein
MAWVTRLLGGLRGLLRRARLERELDDELRDFLEAAVEQKVRNGMSREAATRAVRAQMGSIESVKDHVRDVGWESFLQSAWQDVRYSVRTLRRAPEYAGVAVLTLALGIGANTAIFSIVYPLLLKPLPYARPEELVAVSTYIPQLRSKFPSLPVRAVDFGEFRRSNRVFSEMSAILPADFNLTGVSEPERLYGARVSANLFSVLGVAPEHGRTFLPEEDVEGRDRVVVISHELWVRRFGSDQGVLNRPLSLNGQNCVVVGIMPAGFLFPTGKQLHPLVPLGPRVDVWKPMGFTRDELTSEGSWDWGVLARLRPGTSITAAQEDINRIAEAIVKRVSAQIPRSGFDVRAQLQPLQETFSGNVRQALLVLVSAVGLLLVIACVNLANLLLARISSREPEFATRKALGASRMRLARQLLTESVTIAGIGGIVGLLVASWAGPLLLSLAPPEMPPLPAEPFSRAVLMFAVVAAVAAGIAFGVVPAFEMSRGQAAESLKGGSRTLTPGLRSGRARMLLVTLEVALCTGLLAVAGLLLHSFVNMVNVDKGFAVEKILTADIVLSGREYPPPRAIAFYRELVERVRTLPGVTSAGAVSALPLMRQSSTTQIHLESDTQHRLLERPVAAYRNVTGGYFATMEIPLLAGRLFGDDESGPAAVISASLARALWPGIPHSQVLGRRIRQGDLKSALVTIVGIAGDVRGTALDRDPFPVIYRPHSQGPSREMTLVLRTAHMPETLANAARAEIWKIDANVPAPAVRTMREIVSASTAHRRFETMLIVLFGALALALAVVGIYGVASYAVTSRTQEIGLRIALGAGRPDVIRRIVISGMAPVGIGLAVGLVGARLATTAVRSLLFGVGPLDPVAFGGGCAVLLLAAVVASYIPARRAATVDPVVALRCE